MTPCDAASADARVEYGVPTPRHYATHPGGHHNTVMDMRIWKIQVWLRSQQRNGSGAVHRSHS
jgi:hypothetical protein